VGVTDFWGMAGKGDENTCEFFCFQGVGMGCSPVSFGASPVSVTPATMPRVGTVDERYQSFNIEMVEVTGDASGLRTSRAMRGMRAAANSVPMRRVEAVGAGCSVDGERQAAIY
jgi:hypothetical protein